MNVSRSTSDRKRRKEAERVGEQKQRDRDACVASWLSWYQLIQPGRRWKIKELKKGDGIFSLIDI